jgi:hypothetical protein
MDPRSQEEAIVRLRTATGYKPLRFYKSLIFYGADLHVRDLFVSENDEHLMKAPAGRSSECNLFLTILL